MLTIWTVHLILPLMAKLQLDADTVYVETFCLVYDATRQVHVTKIGLNVQTRLRCLRQAIKAGAL